MQQNNVRFAIVASYLFPFDRDLAVTEAELYLRNKVVNEGVFETIKRGLVFDPYSARYLAFGVQYSVLYKKNDEARFYYEKLKKIVPNSSIVKTLKPNF